MARYKTEIMCVRASKYIEFDKYMFVICQFCSILNYGWPFQNTDL